MIEQFVEYVPRSIMSRSGKVFYSGRDAFSGTRPVYLLDMNPGGDPLDPRERTVAADIDHVLRHTPSRWSAYVDESWVETLPGTGGFQPQIIRFFGALGLDPRLTPSSNLHFVRSKSQADLGSTESEIIDLCWPLHEKVIQKLGVRLLICMGKSCGESVRVRVGAHTVIDTFVEANQRRWTSTLYRAPSGMMVASLTHPSRAYWSNPSVDPSPIVLSAIKRLGSPT